MRDFFDFIEIPIVQGKERIKGADGRTVHPTQKPEKLFELIIKASSNENDIVLDPFFGTGTTGKVAEQLNHQWICIEKNKQYIVVAKGIWVSILYKYARVKPFFRDDCIHLF